MTSGFGHRRFLAHTVRPHMRFVCLGSDVCLQLPSESHLAMGTLAVRRGVPVIKVSKGLAPSSHFPVGFRLPVASAVRRCAPCLAHATVGTPVTQRPPCRPWTCSFPASGSSVALASAQGKTVASSGPVCYGPQGGWRILLRSDMSGMRVLSGLRASVESFPMSWVFPTAAYSARYDSPCRIRRAFPLPVLLRLPPYNTYFTARSLWGLPSSSSSLFLLATA